MGKNNPWWFRLIMGFGLIEAIGLFIILKLVPGVVIIVVGALASAALNNPIPIVVAVVILLLYLKAYGK